MSSSPTDLARRHARQQLLPGIGPAGQRRLAASTVLVVGCGALGTASAELLARAGVGRLRLADRDVVEPTNLQRQLLYDEADAAARVPKAEAAAAHLGRIDSALALEPRVTDVTCRTLGPLLEGVDLVVDGTDNFETRYLLNDACLERALPWIYGGAVGSEGMVLVIRPGRGPCLRCLFPEPPAAGSTPRCDTHGVLGMVTATVGAHQAAEALKLLVGSDDVCPDLLHFDLWHARSGRLAVARDPGCPACVGGRRDFLRADRATTATALCGRDTVQLTPAAGAPPPQLAQLQATLAAADAGPVRATASYLRFAAEGLELTLFADGRALVGGTADEARARAFCARWIGA